MTGNGNGHAAPTRIVLARSASRRALAQQVHDVIVPTVKNHDHNLLWLKAKIEELEARIAALEPKTEA